jgi:hypothetical protein
MSRVIPRSWLLLPLVAACASQDPVLSQRLKAMNERREAERSLESGSGQARLELSLASGGTSWCPSTLQPAQLRATVSTGAVSLQTTVRSGTTTDHVLPREAVQLTATPPVVGAEWVMQTPTQANELMFLMSKPVIVTARLAKNPAVTATLTLTTSFDCNQAVEFPARPGRPGGVGSNRGEDGENGLNVVVSVSYLKPPSGGKLVLVKAAPSEGVPAYFLLAPGKWVGVGVRGGDGGSGGDGLFVPNVQLTGGLGGEGGNGGSALVRYDQRFPELRSAVTVANNGGRGGPGGSSGEFARAAEGRPGRPGPPAKYVGEPPQNLFKDEIEAGMPVMRSSGDGI